MNLKTVLVHSLYLPIFYLISNAKEKILKLFRFLLVSEDTFLKFYRY